MNEAGDGDGGGGGGEGEGGASSSPHWSDGLELGEHGSAAMVREAESAEAFVARALEQQQYVGSSIRVPSQHASAEDVEAFRSKLREHVPTLVDVDPENPESFTAARRAMGMPEKPDGYEVPAVDVGDHGPPAFDEQVAFFRDVAHRNGLTNAQFQSVVKEITEQGARSRGALAAKRQEAMDALKAEWGDAYAQRMSAAKAAVEATDAPPGLLKAMEAGAVDADSLRWLASLHDRLGGASGMSSGDARSGDGHTGAMTPAEAENMLQEIRANPEHPYWKVSDPKHAWAVKEYARLTAISLGEEAQQPAGLDQHVEPTAISAFEGRV